MVTRRGLPAKAQRHKETMNKVQCFTHFHRSHEFAATDLIKLTLLIFFLCAAAFPQSEKQRSNKVAVPGLFSHGGFVNYADGGPSFVRGEQRAQELKAKETLENGDT